MHSILRTFFIFNLSFLSVSSASSVVILSPVVKKFIFAGSNQLTFYSQHPSHALIRMILWTEPVSVSILWSELCG